MRIIAERDDRQKICYRISVKIQVAIFYHRKLKTYIRFDRRVIAEQVKSFLLSYRIIIFIRFISVRNDIMKRYHRTRVLLIKLSWTFNATEGIWIAEHINLQNSVTSQS